MKVVSLIALVFVISACSAPQKQYVKHIASTTPISSDTSFLYSDMPSSHFAFRGELDFSQMDDEAYTMVYPGEAGFVGLLVGIAAHAITENQKQNSRGAKKLAIANRVLLPIQTAIDGVNSADALSQALENQIYSLAAYSEGHDTNHAFVLDFKPVFYVSQDYSTLRVKNIVSLYSAFEDQKTEVYRNLIESVRVLPSGFSEMQPDQIQAELQSLTGLLLTETLGLALDDSTSSLQEKPDFQTFKYLEGGKLSYSRGRLVRVDCSTLVIRTLRSWIKSIPMSLNKDSELTNECSEKSLAFNR
tara:strand:+ start:1235 stop:2140 length:906 start_codon:yes stop_codon:yes gene_type:complete